MKKLKTKKKVKKATSFFDKLPHSEKEAKKAKSLVWYVKDKAGQVWQHSTPERRRLVMMFDAQGIPFLLPENGDGAAETDPRLQWLKRGIGAESDAERELRLRSTAPVRTESRQQSGETVKRPESGAASQPAWRSKQTNDGVDRFGNKLGTRTARINAAISAAEPLTIQEIEERADAHAISSHLSNLVKRGFVVKGRDKKYSTHPNYQETDECRGASTTRDKKRPSKSSSSAAKKSSRLTPTSGSGTTKPKKSPTAASPGSGKGRKGKTKVRVSSSPTSRKAKPAESARRRAKKG